MCLYVYIYTHYIYISVYIYIFTAEGKSSELASFHARGHELRYVPLCHWIWGGGWIAEMGAKDSYALQTVGFPCHIPRAESTRPEPPAHRT